MDKKRYIVAKDKVFMVMLNYNGEFGGTGIYQNSREGEPANVWTKLNFPPCKRIDRSGRSPLFLLATVINTMSTGSQAKGEFCHSKIPAKPLSLLPSPAKGMPTNAHWTRPRTTRSVKNRSVKLRSVMARRMSQRCNHSFIHAVWLYRNTESGVKKAMLETLLEFLV